MALEYTDRNESSPNTAASKEMMLQKARKLWDGVRINTEKLISLENDLAASTEKLAKVNAWTNRTAEALAEDAEYQRLLRKYNISLHGIAHATAKTAAYIICKTLKKEGEKGHELTMHSALNAALEISKLVDDQVKEIEKKSVMLVLENKPSNVLIKEMPRVAGAISDESTASTWQLAENYLHTNNVASESLIELIKNSFESTMSQFHVYYEAHQEEKMKNATN